ncbi:Hypothetical predicted protein [Pelobates cultripes]|uniref:Uncharacterized protein n=1 Tax=Pelobates cultripes TaxID=61616 RepID=A0AAD1RTG6_PELCU|nr:Hypothetical predicted protein [Pelobates cultripes]
MTSGTLLAVSGEDGRQSTIPPNGARQPHCICADRVVVPPLGRRGDPGPHPTATPGGYITPGCGVGPKPKSKMAEATNGRADPQSLKQITDLSRPDTRENRQRISTTGPQMDNYHQRPMGEEEGRRKINNAASLTNTPNHTSHPTVPQKQPPPDYEHATGL